MMLFFATTAMGICEKKARNWYETETTYKFTDRGLYDDFYAARIGGDGICGG